MEHNAAVTTLLSVKDYQTRRGDAPPPVDPSQEIHDAWPRKVDMQNLDGVV